MNIAIIFASLGGNTQDVAEIIADELKELGVHCRMFTVGESPDLSLYDAVIFGSYTWGDGEMPVTMRKYLRQVLKEKPQIIHNASVFGTGDTMYPNFCRAVTEITYHLRSHDVPIRNFSLLVEQSPYSLGQEKKVREWVIELHRGLLHETT